MLNICLASQSQSQSPCLTHSPLAGTHCSLAGFFEFATAKKHKAEQAFEEEEEAEDKGKTVSAKFFNIFFAWAATVSHKEAGSPSSQWRQSQRQLDVFI